jgi:predicted nucleic acid-binding protein
MKEFFDTSVLVAAFWGGHIHHPASVKRLGAANKKQSACSMPTLAEVYAAMTALPIKPMLPPEQVMLFIQEVRDRLTLVSLDEREYFETIEQTAAAGFTSGVRSLSICPVLFTRDLSGSLVRPTACSVD